MEIFIGNLPVNTSAYELRRLFNQAIDKMSGGFLPWKKPHPGQIAIQIVEKGSAAGRIRYGHAVIEPETIARHCIQTLNHHFLNGQPLTVREYFQRSYMNERRALDWREKPWHGPERRADDRRYNQAVAII